jgi:hypothetical protein
MNSDPKKNNINATDDNSLSDQPTYCKTNMSSTTSEKEIALGLELLNIDSLSTEKMYEDFFVEKLMKWK